MPDFGAMHVEQAPDRDGDVRFALYGETWLDVVERQELILHLMRITPQPKPSDYELS